MRVSNRNIYANSLTNMNSALGRLMELNIQAATQKRINKPSDDPSGAARAMGYKSSMSVLDSYKANVDSAKGWLKSADDAYLQVSTILTRLRELGEQASTGTFTAGNREAVGFEARQLFQQLVTISNSTYEGMSLFAGHKVAGDAFRETLTVDHANLTPAASTLPGAANRAPLFTVTGGLARTALVQFTSSGTVGTDALNYRYSLDGGKTFTTKTLGATADTLDLGVAQVKIAAGTVATATDPNNVNDVKGSWLWVRPTAEYLGDDNDPNQPDVMGFGTDPAVAAKASGHLEDDVMVRVDTTPPPAIGAAFEYSYSIDGGQTWTSGQQLPAGASPRQIPIPGGVLQLSGAGAATLTGQYVVRPRQAETTLEIAPGERMAVTAVGKDIFGGLYADPSMNMGEDAFGSPLANANNRFALPADPNGKADKNLFEVVGRLVSALETNRQDGVSQSLEDLREASSHIMSVAASVGGRENRLETAESILSGLALSQKEGLSKVEDADLAELMTNIANQELVYQSVLKSTSGIMKLSLLNYM